MATLIITPDDLKIPDRKGCIEALKSKITGFDLTLHLDDESSIKVDVILFKEGNTTTILECPCD